MNHTLRNRSALIRAAESGLRRERARQASQQILAVCIAGMVVISIALLLGQVFA